MVLDLLPELTNDWAKQPSARRSYPESVERWRADVAKLMPEALKQRPDAERLVDKMLHVVSWESGGDPGAIGDGGIANGLFQSHYVGRGASPEQQIADAWRLVLPNPNQWTDWGEGVTYQGKPFGALGNYPYDSSPAGGGARMSGGGGGGGGGGSYTGGTPDTGSVAARVVAKRLDAETARQGQQDEERRASLETALGAPLAALPHEEEARTSHGPDPVYAHDVAAQARLDTGQTAGGYLGGTFGEEERQQGTEAQDVGFQQARLSSAAQGSIRPPSVGDEGLAPPSTVAGAVGSMFGRAPGAAETAYTDELARLREEEARQIAGSSASGGSGFAPGVVSGMGGGGNAFPGTMPADLSLKDKLLGTAGLAIRGAYQAAGPLEDVPAINALPGGAFLDTTRRGLGAAGLNLPSGPTVGTAWGTDIPGAKAVREAVSNVPSAQLLRRSGIERRLGLDLPSAGDVLSMGVPVTLGGLATNVIGAKGPIEAFTSIPGLDSIRIGASATKASAKASLERLAAAGARAQGAEMVGTVAAARGGVERARLGANAREARYGALVRDGVQQALGPEAAAKTELGLVKTNKTWADYGDMVEALAPEKAPWLQEPASAAVSQGSKALRQDGTVDFEVLRKELRQSVEAVSAERAGQGGREQVSAAARRVRPEVGGEGSMLGRDARQLRTGEQNPVQPEDIAFGEQQTAESAGMREAPSRPGARESLSDYVSRLESMDGKQLRQESNRVRNAAGVGDPAMRAAAVEKLDAFESLMERRQSGNYSPTQPPERPRTSWRVTPAEGAPYTAETLAGARSGSVEEAQATYEANKLAARKAGTEAEGARRLGAAQQAAEGLKRLRNAIVGEPELPGAAPRAARPVGPPEPAVQRLPQAGTPTEAVPEIRLTKDLPANLKPDVREAVGPLRPPPEGEPKGFLNQPERKAQTVVAVHQQPGLDNVGPVSRNGQRVGNMYVGDLPDAPTWVAMTRDSADVQQIEKWRRYYQDNRNNLGSLFQVLTPEEADKYRSAFVRGNVRTSSERAATDVFRMEDRVAGVPREGVGSMNATSIGNVLRGSTDPRGVGPKISDFDDAHLGKTTRTWAGDDPRGESPFVADTHTSRDAGYIDEEVAKYVKAKTGKSLEELGLQYDKAPTPGGSNGFDPSEVQYELVSRWGNQLTRDLNAMEDGKGWLGHQWTTEEVQAVGWGRVRKELGLEDSGFETIRDANTRMLSFPAVARGLEERGTELGPDGLRKVTDRYVDNMLETIKQHIPQARVTKVAGEGLDGARYDVAASPETMDEIALAIAHANESPVHIYRREPKGKDVHLDLTSERPLSTAEMQRIAEAAKPYSRGVTYAEDGGLRIYGAPRTPEGQATLAAAIDAASADVPLDATWGKGTLSVIGEGGDNADTLATLGRTRPDAAGALQSRDPLRAGWLDDALAAGDNAPGPAALTRTGNELPGPSAVSASPVAAGRAAPTGSQPAGAQGFFGTEGIPSFADPLNPTPQELDAVRTALLTEANRLDQTGVSNPMRSWIGDAATLAKRLGDPGSEIRRQLQQNGLMPSIVGGDQENKPRQPSLGDLANQAPESLMARRAAARDLAKESQKPGKSKLWANVTGAFGAPRALALSADTGVARDLTILASSRKGLGAAASGARANIQAYWSPAEAAKAQSWVTEHPIHDFVTSTQNFDRPFHVYSYGGGTPSDLRVPEMSSLNESRVSRTIGGLSWVERSDRALSVGRNVAGMELLSKRYDELAQIYGTESMRFYSEMQSTIDWVNNIRGYSGSALSKNLGALNFLTSPQQMVSRLQLAIDPIVFAKRGDLNSARFAAENLLGFAASQASYLTLLKIAERGNGGAWSVNMNPTSSDFGQVKVGNTRFDTLAGLGPIIKLLGRAGAATSDSLLGTELAPDDQAELGTLLMRWFENKENPSAALVTDYVFHNKLPSEEDLLGLVVPSLVMGINDVYQNESGATQKALYPGVAGAQFLGVGTTTYKSGQDVARETAQGMGFKDYQGLETTKKLQVLDKAPPEARKGAGNPYSEARKSYEAAIKKAGYVEPEKAPEDKVESTAEEKARARRNKPVNEKNAEIIAKDPELEVQKWFFTKAHGGELDNKDSVSGALELGLADREVKFAGHSRNLAASDDDKKFWKDYGKVLDNIENGAVSSKSNLDQAAQFKFKKNYDQLDETEKDTAEAYIRSSLKKDAKVEALMIFAGKEGPNADGEYTASSAAVTTELQKLWKDYPKAAKLPLAENSKGKKTSLVQKGR